MFSILFLKFYYINSSLIMLSLRPTFIWVGFYNHCSLDWFQSSNNISIPHHIRIEAVLLYITLTNLNTPLLIPLQLLLYTLKHTDLLIIIQISISAKLLVILTWPYFLNSTSFSFPRLSLSVTNFSITCFLNNRLPYFATARFRVSSSKWSDIKQIWMLSFVCYCTINLTVSAHQKSHYTWEML